jgi:hypothetical protein
MIKPGDLVTLWSGAVIFVNTIKGDVSASAVMQQQELALVVAIKPQLEDDGWIIDDGLRPGGFYLVIADGALGWVTTDDMVDE